jgi:hypothetical protein
MMVFNTAFLKFMLSALSNMPGGAGSAATLLPWTLLVVGLAKVAKKVDDIVSRIGLGSVRTGGALNHGGLMYPVMVARALSGVVSKTAGAAKSAGNTPKTGTRGGAGPRPSAPHPSANGGNPSGTPSGGALSPPQTPQPSTAESTPPHGACGPGTDNGAPPSRPPVGVHGVYGKGDMRFSGQSAFHEARQANSRVDTGTPLYDGGSFDEWNNQQQFGGDNANYPVSQRPVGMKPGPGNYRGTIQPPLSINTRTAGAPISSEAGDAAAQAQHGAGIRADAVEGIAQPLSADIRTPGAKINSKSPKGTPSFNQQPPGVRPDGTATGAQQPLSTGTRTPVASASQTPPKTAGSQRQIRPGKKVNIDIYRDDDPPARAVHSPQGGTSSVSSIPAVNTSRAESQTPQNSSAQTQTPIAPASVSSQRGGRIGGVRNRSGSERAPSKAAPIAMSKPQVNSNDHSAAQVNTSPSLGEHSAITAKTGQAPYSSVQSAGSETRRNSPEAVPQGVGTARPMSGGAQYRITESTLQKVDTHYCRSPSATPAKDSGKPGQAQQIQRQTGSISQRNRPVTDILSGKPTPGIMPPANKPFTRRRGI